MTNEQIGIAIAIIFILVLAYFAFKDKVSFKKSKKEDSVAQTNMDLAAQINA